MIDPFLITVFLLALWLYAQARLTARGIRRNRSEMEEAERKSADANRPS